MASVNSLGVGSGVLTSDLVDDLIAAQREATDLRIEAQRGEAQARISALGAVRSNLDGLLSAASQLGDANSLISTVATSTDEAVVTATAESDANPGIHTVEVLATARAQTLTSVRFDSPDALVGDGVINFRFGTTTFDNGNYDTFTENPDRASGQVVIDSSNNTLAGIRDAINNAALGVNASVVNDGQGFVLVLSSAETGADNSLEVTVTEGDTPGLSAFSFNAAASTPGTNLTQTVNADDAIVTIDGITVTRSTNVVDEVIPGVSFNILGTNAGTPATLTIAQDNEQITERLQTFVDAYNEFLELTDELTAFSEDDGGSLFTGDATIRTLTSTLGRFISSSVSNIDSNAFRALVDLGVSTNQNLDFRLELNASTFQSALASNADDVVALLAEQRRASDNQITFVGALNTTIAGSYDVDISQLATQASLTGAAVPGLAGPIVIDDDNDTLTLVVDGVSSGTITLAQDTYADGEALAQELQSQINQDASLNAASAAVAVTFDADTQQLSLQSTVFGSGSSIGISAVDTNTLADLGLGVVDASENTGVDVAGTINGIEGTGTGQFLTIPNGPVPARSGTFTGQGITAFDTPPLTINGDNNTFSINVDGVIAQDVTLTSGDFASGSELAAEIESQINANSALVDAELSVAVRFDGANNRFEISSASTGINSSVSITAASAGVVSDLGLAVGVGEPGTGATTIADPAGGIQIQVQGEQLGERGNITLVRGIANQIEQFISQVTGFGGTLSNALDSLDAQVEDIDEEAQTIDDRFDLLEARLRTQFAAADALIATLNNTSQFLDQQLDTLPGFSQDS